MNSILVELGLIPEAQAYVSGAFEASDFTPITTVATSAITVGLSAGLAVFAIVIGIKLIMKVLGMLGVRR